MRVRVASSLIVLTFVVGCAASTPSSSADAPDLAADERAIREADARWLKAAGARDAAGEAALYAADGVAYREHLDPAVGPSAIQAQAAQFNARNPTAQVTWTTDTVHVAQAGDLAVQTGQVRLTGLGPKGEIEDRSRFVTVWKKVNGEWKVAYDIGATTMPETPGQ